MGSIRPETILYTSYLDTNLVRALSEHWRVIVARQGDKVIMELYTKAIKND